MTISSSSILLFFFALAPLASQTSGATQAVPPLPVGTVPMYFDDPVVPAPGEHAGFGCFGACGASCACEGRTYEVVTTSFEGKTCRWKTTSCLTHSFCQWHDGCYSSCDKTFPDSDFLGNLQREACNRTCDESCVYGNDPQPIGGWADSSLDPGPPPETLGGVMCARRLASDPTVPFDGRIVYADLINCD